jgi:hypothetical protein
MFLAEWPQAILKKYAHSTTAVHSYIAESLGFGWHTIVAVKIEQ